MLRIFHDTKYDFIKWWKVAAITTIAFMLIGVASFAVTGDVNYSVEFTGGTLVQLKFKQPPDAAKIRAALDAADIKSAEVQQFGGPDEFIIRAQEKSLVSQQAAGAEKVADRIHAALARSLGESSFTVARTESISPRVGEELSRNALIAMVLVSIATLIYLAIRFEWRFGVAAVVSTLHDRQRHFKMHDLDERNRDDRVVECGDDGGDAKAPLETNCEINQCRDRDQHHRDHCVAAQLFADPRAD